MSTIRCNITLLKYTNHSIYGMIYNIIYQQGHLGLTVLKLCIDYMS